MMINNNTEIRKLPSAASYNLAKILEDSWMKLMALIPKTRDGTGGYKYNVEHLRLIENAANQQRRPGAEIFLEEWSTSGKTRPDVGFLLQLLMKAELYRAADYVSVELLNGPPANRPLDGPAASIDTNLLMHGAANSPQSMEQLLDQMTYPNSSIIYHQISNDINKDYYQKVVIKKCSNRNKDPVISDLIEFSKSQPMSATSKQTIGNIEVYQDNEHHIAVGRHSAIHEDANVAIEEIIQSRALTPAFSALLNPEPDGEDLSIGDYQISKDDSDIPNFNLLQSNNSTSYISHQSEDSTSMSNTDVLNSNLNSNYIPNLSIIHNEHSAEDIGFELPNISALYLNQAESVSPLPNLSALNLQLQDSFNNESESQPLAKCSTNLPHFLYESLEQNTDYFNDDQCSNIRLGSGAFGTVYLSVTLLSTPVAVKRINCDKSDANTTKYFINEVEIMGRYKHEHLLQLLGYSCDGPNYCLVYEYMEGGTLKDRLQDKADYLCYTIRLSIALGCAKGIEFLHTSPVPLIHRDVKSANILLDDKCSPKLSDFGLVKTSPSGSGSMTGTSILGTSAYMAPEAFRGDVSVKLDCFSYGVVLLELITSLPSLDDQRDGCDLVTHIEEHCEGRADGIDALVDQSVGEGEVEWLYAARELYSISRKCLQDKRHRPLMTVVLNEINNLYEKTDQATHISKMDPDFAHVWTKIASLLTRVKSLPTGCESPPERSVQKRSSGDSHPADNDFTRVSKDAIFVQTCAKSGSIFDICGAWSVLYKVNG